MITGVFHTIALSDDGVVHSFGKNKHGQLGLGHNRDISVPMPIPELLHINQISCGAFFSVCVDNEGFLWAFGHNTYGQLGTGNDTNFNIPQKIQDIPPVLSVSCGPYHTFIITNDDNLWSCGNNNYGQLCLGNKENQVKFQHTQFSNISKVSLGDSFSIFRNEKGEIYSCGCNENGELGLGHFNKSQITPTLIPNLPPNIVQFICGFGHTLFLDSEGKVFSVGDNRYGQLGLGDNVNQNVLNQIPTIPPIQLISCVGFSNYLIDFEGNVWSFGNNRNGRLGLGDSAHKNIPTKIQSLKDIQQLSYGSCGCHFFAKDSRDTIFVAGCNGNGQHGTKNKESKTIPTEIDPQYFTIWEKSVNLNTHAKSARK